MLTTQIQTDFNMQFYELDYRSLCVHLLLQSRLTTYIRTFFHLFIYSKGSPLANVNGTS